MLLDYDYKYDQVVIGNDLDSASFAYDENVPLISTDIVPPLFFETVEEGSIHIDDVEVNSKKEVWEFLRFELSLAGLLPFADKVARLTVEEGLIRITTKKNKLIKVAYDTLHIFNDAGVLGIEDKLEERSDRYMVLDWFDVRTGSKHEFETLTGDSDFVQEIYFFKSPRVDGAHGFKDLIAVSYLTKQQVEGDEYTSLLARYRVLQMMKAAGIRGKRNGRDPKDKTRYKFRSVAIEARKRDVMMLGKNRYKSDSRVIFH